MYQYQIEPMEKRIKNLKRFNANVFLLILSIVMLLAASIEADKVVLIFALLFFIYVAGRRYFVDPILMKLEMVESDVEKIKHSIKLPEDKRY